MDEEVKPNVISLPGGPTPEELADPVKKKKLVNTHHWVTNVKGEKIWAPKGTNPDHLPREVWPFAEETCQAILRKIIEGHTMSKICAMPGFPPVYVIYDWRRKHSEFDEEIKKARSQQAEYFADQMLEIANDPDNESTSVKRDKLRLEAYKWLAEKQNPDAYGNKTKITSESNHTLTLVVETGVRRDIDLKPIEVPFTKVFEDTSK